MNEISNSYTNNGFQRFHSICTLRFCVHIAYTIHNDVNGFCDDDDNDECV